MRLTIVFGLLLWVGVSHAAKPVSDEKRAEAHMAKGIALEGEGSFEEAILEFSAAQAIAPSPETSLHIGECHEALGKTLMATVSYKRYLIEIGDVPQAAEMRKHVAELEASFHVAEGKRLIGDKQFAAALKEYEAAQKAKPDPKVWYDMGVCHEELGEPALAIESYQRYLKDNPEAGDTGEVQGRIAVLSGTKIAPPPPPPVAPPPPPPPPWFTSRAGWAFAIGAVGLAAGSGAMFGLASTASGNADRAMTEADFNGFVDNGRLYSKLGVTFAALAGVALVAGIVSFALHARPEAPPPQKTPVQALRLVPTAESFARERFVHETLSASASPFLPLFAGVR